MPVVGTKAAASSQGFGEFARAGSEPVYIESVFSTYLYTGNGSTQTITNGIDLAGQGGLTWIKKRNAAEDHILTDTVRGAGNTLFSNLTSANEYDITRLSAFTSSGFSVGTSFRVNQSGNTYTSWTFRKQPKFFDVVTYTGNGSNRTIAHNLGSVPGCIIIKCTSQAYVWGVYHRGMTSAAYAMQLQATDAQSSSPTYFNSTAPTSTVFSVGTANATNASGQTYVAYLFAHNAGGFGASGSDNVISCGSYTGTGNTSLNVNLGYEPQWVMIKNATADASATGWYMQDNMRGMTASTIENGVLYANLSSAEAAKNSHITATATGFTCSSSDSDFNSSGVTYIYIAIRRGPMKTPTSGTSVFTPFYFAGDSSTSRQLSAGAPTDLFYGFRTIGDGAAFVDRLRGKDLALLPAYTQAETTYSLYCRFDSNTGPIIGWNAASGININGSGWNYRAGAFRRAPGFFDEVCYTGNGSTQNVSHNLGVAPELMIIKSRSAVGYWPVYAAPLGNSAILQLEDPGAVQTGAPQWNSTTPTASVFSLGTSSGANASGTTFVAYLFASCPGVSKVGSYTGTGGTQTISCGFAVRFVMIKRTDSTGDWWVWDTARGMVSGTDQRFAFNSASGEVNANWVYTNASGFQIVTTDATVNASGGSYIFLAIA